MSIKIKFKQIAFPSNNKAFIKGDGTLDLSNYVILDENAKIPEEYIPDSVILKAIYYEDFINADYIPKLGETIIIIDYLKVDNKNVPSFVIGDGTTTLKELSPSGDFSKWKETIDYSQSAEPTLDTSKEDTVKGHISYLAKSVNWIKSQFSKYLSLSGGTMTGAIDMNKNSFLNARFEIVDELPTTNLFVGRKVVMKGVEYTYSGQQWVAQGFSRFQILDTNKSFVSGVTESYLNNVCLFKSIPTYYMYHGQTLGRIVKAKKVQYYNALTDSWSTADSSVKTMKNTGDKMQFTLNDVAPTDSYGDITAFESKHYFRGYNVEFLIEYLIFRNLLGDNDTTNLENYSWYSVKKFQSNTDTHFVILPQRSINKTTIKTGASIIGDVRVTLTVLSEASNALIQTTSFRFYISKRYDIENFPQTINYDAEIEPTQTTIVEKSTNWTLQYLTQGVHWLRNNLSNFIKSGSNATLGDVTATKFTKSGGTSSQFLKADGSTDSTSYQSTISDLADIRTNASNGNTAYSWGNHADAGYAIQSEVTEELSNVYNALLNEIPTELPPTDNSVTNAKIADDSISTSKIQDKAIIGSKIGYQEISTDHIVNKSITNEKLVNRSIMLNGTPIVLGGTGQISGFVTANGYKCFLEIANNELILSSPTFAENGSIATVEEIVRYPLYTELPTIPNPTANATEITNINNWFNPNINSYIIPEDLMYEVLKGSVPMSQMLLQLNGASCTLTSYNLGFKLTGVDMSTLITDLTTREGYEVYVENDIDSITTSGICTLKFKIDGNNIIIECYKKIV